MQLRKSLSIFLSLCMMLSIMSTPVTVSATSTDTWQSLQTAINAGGTVTLDDDVTALAGDATLTVPADMTVTLNLNGHTIDRALSSPADSGSIIIVKGTLTICDTSSSHDGTITGGNTTGTGGGIWVRGGTVTLESGAITGNNAQEAAHHSR